MTQISGADDYDDDYNNNDNTVVSNCDNLFIHIIYFAQWCKETQFTDYLS